MVEAAVAVVTNTISSGLSLEQIRELIAVCSQTEDGEPLRGAMRSLKVALLANPEACAAMLPQDVGAAVVELRRMTGQQISAEAAKAAAKTRKPKIDLSSPEAMKDIEDNLFDGDSV